MHGAGLYILHGITSYISVFFKVWGAKIDEILKAAFHVIQQEIVLLKLELGGVVFDEWDH